MKSQTWKLLPLMFGFFIMGFVDVIGIAISHIKLDFQLSDSIVNTIPFFGFIWFLFLSVPTGMLMNRIGRKKTVLLSFIIQVVALVLPLIRYDFGFMLVAFALLGIGNTLLQVALNPLVSNVVSPDRLTSTLTLGQFVKAICSFLGPILTAAVVGSFLGWKMIFPIYGLLSLLATVWLACTPIAETQPESKNSSIGSILGLLKDRYILLLFLGITVLVGADVGMNITLPKYLMERCSLEINEAGLGNSLYFFSRTAGAFLGALLLLRLSARHFFIWSVILALGGLVITLLFGNLWAILAGVILFGLGYANLFSIIFSYALQYRSDQANEISSLLIMGVFGGAILPPILGVVSDSLDQWAAMALLALVWLYLFTLFHKLR